MADHVPTDMRPPAVRMAEQWDQLVTSMRAAGFELTFDRKSRLYIKAPDGMDYGHVVGEAAMNAFFMGVALSFKHLRPKKTPARPGS